MCEIEPTSDFRPIFQYVIGILSRTKNLHDFRKLAKMTESTKFEMVITQKLFNLQPYGLTCVVILTCGLILLNSEV